jgi:sulfite reductase alpha subunit-like flavoprotein
MISKRREQIKASGKDAIEDLRKPMAKHEKGSMSLYFTDPSDGPKDSSVGEMILFFGCRTRHEDFLYRDEWLTKFNHNSTFDPMKEHVHEHKGLTEMNVAFSREREEKVYVQHMINSDKEKLWNLIKKKDTVLYVCGDGKKMAFDVRRTLTEIGLDHGITDLVKELKKSSRYFEDIW